MERLNYQHLLYVWMVAHEGTIARAAARLGLAPSTLSTQINAFQETLGERLFVRRGRRVELTEAGRVALHYADQIFPLGQELREMLKGQRVARPAWLVVGVLDAVSKPMVQRILAPLLAHPDSIRVVIREDGSLDDFLVELATCAVDVLLADAPASPAIPARIFNHLLGEAGTSFFAAPRLARRLRRRFPRSLDGAAVLLPGKKSAGHRALEQWLAGQRLRPQIVAEVDDSAMLKLLGEAGRGVFAAPSVDERDIQRRYRVEVVGRATAVRQRLYAITGERRIRHPGVLAITDRARREVFG